MVAFLTALPAFIAALPEMLKTIAKVMAIAEKLMAVAKANDVNRWLEDLEGTIDKLEHANTIDSKKDAAKDLLNRMRDIRK
jgi:molecular chaperone GrpE (heat shock protein)